MRTNTFVFTRWASLSFVAIVRKVLFAERGRPGPAVSLLDPRGRAASKAVAGAACAQAAVAALRGTPAAVHGARGGVYLPPSLSPRELLSLSASLLLQAREALAGPSQHFQNADLKASQLEPHDECFEAFPDGAHSVFQVVLVRTPDRSCWEVHVGGEKFAISTSAARAHELSCALNQTVELWAQANSVARCIQGSEQ